MNILVTGATGFLGKEVVSQLVRRGDEVTMLVRQANSAHRTNSVQVALGDLQNLADVRAATKTVDAVIHLGAKVGVWGRYQDFYRTNVVGTENVIQACLANRVPKIVYCSTPSVVFDGAPIQNGDETLSYAKHFLSHYQKTKAIAEQMVLQANERDGLETVALRPHAIWGIGDTHSIPRLFAAAKNRKLKIVGTGNNLISMTHVTNAAHAHIQALESDQVGGKAYFVNDPIPVSLWNWYRRLLEAAGFQLPQKKLSYVAAKRLGRLLEICHTLFPFLGPPRITRYMAAILATDHYFQTGRAEADFGFRSVVSIEDEMDKLLSDLRKKR